MVVQEIRTPGLIILPQRCEEVEEFAKELSATAKVKQEDKLTGSIRFVWKSLGADHYFHSLLFCIMASDHVPTVTDKRMMSVWRGRPVQTYADTGDSAWDAQIR